MQSNQTPTLIPLAWAQNGTKNAIPEASQITITPGAASLNDGFPPICAIKVAAGGIAPAYGDFNGVFNLITQSIRWAHGGGRYAFSSTFAADANVSGYPAGAMLMSADTLGSWISLDDANTDDPDTGAGTKWVPGHQYGITPITGLTNANVTLTPAQAAKSKITLAGTLTGNVQIIFPAWTKEWEVVNNTTGAFTITAKTAAGSGVALSAGQQKITGDGTNITQPAESVAVATQAEHAAQLGQVLGKFQAITSSGSFTVPTGVTTVYATVIPAAGGGGGGGSALGSSTTSGAGGGGGGGGAGAPIIKSPITVVPGQVLTVTIGAAGTGGPGSQAIATAASNGTAGGTTTITGTSPTVNVSVGGGSGGSAGNNANGSTSSTVSAGGTGAAGANAGGYGVIGNGAVFGGAGGAGASMGPYGICGGTPGPNGGNAPGTAGNNANGNGAGGSGGNGGSAATSTAVEGGAKGGNGTPAYVLLEW